VKKKFPNKFKSQCLFSHSVYVVHKSNQVFVTIKPGVKNNVIKNYTTKHF